MNGLALLIAFAAPAIGQEAARPGQGNFLIFTYTTELQRRGLKPDQTYYAVLVNGSAAVKPDKSIDPQAIDMEALKKALRGLRRQDPPETVSIDIFFDKPRPAEEGRYLLHLACKGLASEAGFPNATVGTTFGGTDPWKRALDAIKRYGDPGKDGGEENAVGNEIARAYPIRTALSKYQHHDADCLVEILAPFVEGSKGDLTAAQEKAIMACVAELKLPTQKSIVFNVHRKIGERGAVLAFHEGPAKQLAKKLGFESYSVLTHQD
jgi:hypothetical protein